MSEFEFAALIGLDWGDTSHEVALWDEQRQTHGSERIEHSPAALSAWVEALHARFGGRRVAVAIEQSRGAVFDALSGYPFLTLYPINPRSAARYREAFHPSHSKNDPTDAASLLDLLHKHREELRPFVPDDPSTRLLRLLTEDRRELVDQRTQHVQRLTDRLKTYYPQALRWAGALITAQACDFLERWPTLQAIQKARPSAIREFYRSGIAPVLRRSGKTATVHMRWACPRFLRQTFHEYARVSIGQSLWARAFYAQQRTRGHSQHEAIRALAYRWIRILYAAWNNRTTYDEAHYLQQLAKRGSPLASAPH